MYENRNHRAEVQPAKNEGNSLDNACHMFRQPQLHNGAGANEDRDSEQESTATTDANLGRHDAILPGRRRLSRVAQR